MDEDIEIRMKYDAKLLIKLALIFFGLMFFICILLGRRTEIKKEPEGDKIALQDVKILLEELNSSLFDTTVLSGVSDRLTYGQYITICRELDEEVPGLPDYGNRYEPQHEMLKEDWYAAYRVMLAYLDVESSIWETTIFLLKTDEKTKDAYTENSTNQEPYHYFSTEFEQNVLRKMRVYVKGSSLLTVAEVLPEEYELENVWVAESSEGVMECFYHQTFFSVAADKTVNREQIADLTFRDGRVIDTNEKTEKIHGKLLRVSEEALEIEDSGVYPIEDGMEVYKLYGTLETLNRKDLRIGYADADYVIEKGKICACLVSEREKADKIRVLIKNTAKNSNYFDAAELIVDDETLRIEEQDLEIGERRIYSCAALTDKILLNLEGIKKEDNAYRGTIECYRNAEGMVLINELPLEEYLYAVVPSEMPASYPQESLKAQAVCARTYAYRYILHAGLPDVGAHVDDTTTYQVYHNCSENVATTTAVKETDGMLLTYQGEPAQNYYYSTSCGVGTDADIWKSGGEKDISYIRGIRMNRDTYIASESGEGADGIQDEEAANNSSTVDELRDEENFRQFITSTDESDLEYREPWYRWTYTVEKIDMQTILSRIKERYATSPEAVLTKAEGEYFVSQDIGEMGKIREMDIVRRGTGGVADELMIETDTGTYKILAEYNIRYVLCDRKSEVVRQDGSTVAASSLLPSGFFIIEAGNKGENMIGYTLIGGGYGHGAGMSQNGAKVLGEEGASYDGILEFYFPECELQSINQDADL